MRRKKTSKHGRAISILVAGGIGYLIGGWQTAGLRGTDPSAAEAIALRFPQGWDNVSPTPPTSPAMSAVSTVSSAMGTVQFALLSPEPMVPQTASRAAPQEMPRATVQLAALEEIDASAQVAKGAPSAAATPPASASTAAAIAARHHASPPGYVLDDAQIASIKERLNLTADQERIWPAVEVALRNVSYTGMQQQRRRGNTGIVQSASVDPNSVEVQDLKSAAAPLLMSFSAEQKEEVRNLAHVMGLDQLAKQF